MVKITTIEKNNFVRLFNRGGYVLDFSTEYFDMFTLDSIGLALCNHYGMSKGKSLTAYINEANESNVIKILSDLLKYYESHYQQEIEYVDGNKNYYSSYIKIKEYQSLYKKCRATIDRIESNTTTFINAGSDLKDKFSSGYISAQIDIMLKMQNENPTEAIGKSKELIESCCKTIIENSKNNTDDHWDVNKLVKETMKLLNISTENISENTNESKTIKAILGNLHGIAINVAGLRNAYGSGHGKSASYKGLTVRHAKLAVGSSITLVNYLWDTYEWRKQNSTNTNNPCN